MQDNKDISFFWGAFLNESNRDEHLRYYDCYYFDNTEEWANKLLKLVLQGTKKATSASLYIYEKCGMSLPKIGDLSIITDWEGTPYCVIETTNVTILPFKDMTFDICKREGEDDNLKSWQDGHIAFFTEDGETEGYTFSWDMPIVFQDFEVVYTR